MPGLNLPTSATRKLTINGIYIADRTMTYNKSTGEMKYKVVFNKYVQVFDSKTIEAMVQGSGVFDDTLNGKPLELGNFTGTLTVVAPPEKPTIPTVPTGNGWVAPKPDDFSDRVYQFGKGTKWNNSDTTNTPQIEYRLVFLNELQKKQQEFLKDKKVTVGGNYIIEDTLDENQQFYNQDSAYGKYTNGAPFYVELPALSVGTGSIINGGVGGPLYNGNGEINSIVTGDYFTEVTSKTAGVNISSSMSQKEKNEAITSYVKKHTLTWSVTTDPDTNKQTLTINMGKLDGTDGTLKWDMCQNKNYPIKWFENKINECDQKIKAITSGENSPITLLDTRRQNVVNLLADAVKDDAEKKAILEEWRDTYHTWRNQPNVGANQPIDDGNLPDCTALNKLLDVPVGSNKTPLKNTQQYKDFEKSLNNLVTDQAVFLANRAQYAVQWNAAKQVYQNSLDFYSEGYIFGFSLKYMVTSINTSATTYTNSAKVSMDDATWNASSSTEVHFKSGIKGNFNLGSIVVQKADEAYSTDANDVDDIKKVETDKAGLGGAHFKVYCADGKTDEFLENDEQLSWFVNKDGSEDGKTYTYVYTGGDNEANDMVTSDLVSDDEGKLILGKLTASHSHYLIETKAPDGYYLDTTPTKIGSSKNAVTYKLKGNVSRSIKLYKKDSYSGNPVEGATFTIYKKDGTEVTGFEKKSINGHETFVKKNGGSAVLKTDKDGELCVHGLDAGSYIIRETEEAAGYKSVSKQNVVEYEFTLDEKLPDKDKDKDKYDDNYHLLLNSSDKPATNDLGVATLSFTKTDGKTGEKLENAKFGLFRFTGTEEEWKENPDNPSKWEVVDLTDTKDGYFHTENTTADVKLNFKFPGAEDGNFPTVVTNDKGEVNIEDIPLGHYSLSELKAPADYERDMHSAYFDVNEKTVDKSLQLYSEISGSTSSELKDNELRNYKYLAKLKLVKYATENGKPEIEGTKYQDGWLYSDAQIKSKGLAGATYKLFMQTGGRPNVTNPNPEELKSKDMSIVNSSKYDDCIGIGTTDENGVLDISQFKNKNGNVSFKDGIHMEEYYLVEVEAPTGYKLDQTPIMYSLTEQTFPKDNEGNIIKGKVPGLVKVASNMEYRYGIKLIKQDATDGSHLGGVGFTISKADGTPVKVRSNNVDGYYVAAEEDKDLVDIMYTSKSEGKIAINGVEPNTEYKFTEVDPATGYEKPKDSYTFKTPASPDEDGVVQKGNLLYTSNIVANARLKGKVELHKEDGESQADLAGAKFKLFKVTTEKINEGDSDYDQNNPDAVRTVETLVSEKTTDTDGNVSWDGLEWGDYYLIESKAPEGYVLDQRHFEFEVGEECFTESGDVVFVVFPYIRNRHGISAKMVITKEDAADSSVKLSGAQFMLFKKIHDAVADVDYEVLYGKGIYETGKDSTMEIYLPQGEYMLKEIKAPAGYELPEGDASRIRFTVDPATDDNIVTVPMTITNIKHIDRYGQIDLTKKDKDTDKVLEGARFQLYTVENVDGHEVETPTGSPKSTDENGKVTFDKLDLTKTYRVKEIKAPNGYILDETAHEVVFNRENIDQTAELTVYNSQIEGSVKLTKVDDTEEAKGLEGAEFDLYKLSKEADEKNPAVWEPYGEQTYTTDKNGEINIDLPYGKYYFVETKAPQGYLLGTQDKIEFSIENDKETITLDPIVNKKIPEEKTQDVKVIKTWKNHPDTTLRGAKFQLYTMGESGKYALYSDEVYKTDGDGTFTVSNLPKGNYAFKEIDAPFGYELSDEYYCFAISEESLDKQETISVEIENIKKSEVPEEPEVPSTPDTPDTPDEPSTPDTPVDTDHSNDNNTDNNINSSTDYSQIQIVETNKTAQTGDNVAVGLILIVLIASLGGICVFNRKGKKK